VSKTDVDFDNSLIFIFPRLAVQNRRWRRKTIINAPLSISLKCAAPVSIIWKIRRFDAQQNGGLRDCQHGRAAFRTSRLFNRRRLVNNKSMVGDDFNKADLSQNRK
jgi:hypothetical protein